MYMYDFGIIGTVIDRKMLIVLFGRFFVFLFRFLFVFLFEGEGKGKGCN